MAGTVNQELGLLFQGPNYVIAKKVAKLVKRWKNTTTLKLMSFSQL